MQEKSLQFATRTRVTAALCVVSTRGHGCMHGLRNCARAPWLLTAGCLCAGPVSTHAQRAVWRAQRQSQATPTWLIVTSDGLPCHVGPTASSTWSLWSSPSDTNPALHLSLKNLPSSLHFHCFYFFNFSKLEREEIFWARRSRKR